MSSGKVLGGGGINGKGNNGISGIPSGSRKMVQSLKEIVNNCTEQEIYAMLKECNMDPNETVNRLLAQGLLFLSLSLYIYIYICIYIKVWFFILYFLGFDLVSRFWNGFSFHCFAPFWLMIGNKLDDFIFFGGLF